MLRWIITTRAWLGAVKAMVPRRFSRSAAAYAGASLTKLINVSHAAALSDNAEAWQAVLRRGAEGILEHHDTVHAGLQDFEGVRQAPSPRGHCVALANPHESCLARRLSELIAGILEMLIVHRSVLSPTAYESSITYVTLPLLVAVACALAACGERKTATGTSQPSAWTNPLMRAPTMVISFRETAGTSRGNAGDALAWVGVHAVDVRPQRQKDTTDARRPVLAMHMVNGKQGAEGHMVACSRPPWHNGVSSIFDIVRSNMHAMGVEWGGAQVHAHDTIARDATQCVKYKHRHWLAALTTATMPVVPSVVAPTTTRRKTATHKTAPDHADDRPHRVAKTRRTRAGSKLAHDN